MLFSADENLCFSCESSTSMCTKIQMVLSLLQLHFEDCCSIRADSTDFDDHNGVAQPWLHSHADDQKSDPAL